MPIDRLNNMTHEEYFSVYPYDADIRVAYATELQDELDEYFDDLIEEGKEIKRDDFKRLFLIWLIFVANDQYKQAENAIELFEINFGISLDDRAERIANMLYESQETARFNQFIGGGSDDYNTQQGTADTQRALENADNREISVARNETSALCNEMLNVEAEALGFTEKTWVAIIDKNTRDAHRDVNGTTIPIDEYFEVGGEYMMYPNDENASPENVSNCRCHLEYS